MEFYCQLEQQPAYPASQCAQLPFQYIREDTGKIAVCILGIQVAGIELNGLFNVIIMGGTVILAVVTAHSAPRLISQPDRVSIFIHFFILHMQKIPFVGSSVTENSVTAVFLGAFLETSVNRNSDWWKKRQLSFPSTARTAGGSDRPGAAKAPGLSPAFPSSPVFFAS